MQRTLRWRVAADVASGRWQGAVGGWAAVYAACLCLCSCFIDNMDMCACVVRYELLLVELGTVMRQLLHVKRVLLH